jgi:hypothetical protein
MRSKMIDDKQFVQDGDLYLVRRALKPDELPQTKGTKP